MQGVIKRRHGQAAEGQQLLLRLSPARPVSVLVIQAEGASRAAGLYLTTALSSSAGRRRSRPMSCRAARVTQADLEGRSLVVLNDATIGSVAANLLKTYVERGGGLFIVLGDRTPVSGDWPLLPGKLGDPVDRMRPARRHARVPRLQPRRSSTSSRIRGTAASRTCGSSSTAGLTPAEGDRVLARFDDGAAAMVERRVGNGRVMAFTSTLDGDVERRADARDVPAARCTRWRPIWRSTSGAGAVADRRADVRLVGARRRPSCARGRPGRRRPPA